MGNVHLEGRVPHRSIAALLQDAKRCRTSADVSKLVLRIRHVVRGICALVAEFRSSIPAGERRRGCRHHVAKDLPGYAAKEYRPVADAFCAVSSLGSDEICGPSVGWTLKKWIGVPVGSYDDRASLLISMLWRGDDGVRVVRDMIDGGFDLRFHMNQACHVGGGLHLLAEHAEQYVWLNQLLLVLKDEELVGPAYLQRTQVGQWRESPEWPQGSIEGEQRAAASQVLSEGLDAYDNRNFRHAPPCRTLLNAVTDRATGGASAEQVMAYIREVFALIYRGSHVFLYNELRHGRGVTNPFDLEDASVLDSKEFLLEEVLATSLAQAVRNILPPIEGVRRGDFTGFFKSRVP